MVEVTSPSGLARATRFALSAVASCQAENRDRWCGWVDGSATLYAPGVAQAGVDLNRLLVVRPEPADLARVAVRLVSSQVFSVVVVDRTGVPGSELHLPRSIRWNTTVRRLALAAENSDCTILLLSNESQSREALPTAMRIELKRPALDRLHMRIAKERRGRLTGSLSIPLVSFCSSPNGSSKDFSLPGHHGETHRRHRVA